jgi:antitoxin CcdA
MSSLPKKRAFNLLMNEMIVLEAREPSGNLSATVETLLIELVNRQEDAKVSRQQLAAAVFEAWNQFNASHGSFANEWTTL